MWVCVCEGGVVPFRQSWPCTDLTGSLCPPTGFGRSEASGRSSFWSGTAAARRRSPESSGWALSRRPGTLWRFGLLLGGPPPHPSPPAQHLLCQRVIWCRGVFLFFSLCTGEKYNEDEFFYFFERAKYLSLWGSPENKNFQKVENNVFWENTAQS